MKGTEKQVRWATDIIDNARRCIAANIENCKGNKALEREIPAWERISERFEAYMDHPKMQDAGWVINNRNNKIFDPIQLMNEIRITASRKRITYAEAALEVVG